MKKFKKELTDILSKIGEETFYGEEEKSVHPGMEVTFEYSPGRFCMMNKNDNLPNDSFVEMAFSDKCKVSSYREKNAFTGEVKEYDQEGVKSLNKYGIVSNFLRRDPRYVIANSKSYKKTSEGRYTMTVWDEGAKELMKLSKESEGQMVDVMQSAEISIEGDKLKRMIVKTCFLKKSGIVEKTFTDITFKYV